MKKHNWLLVVLVGLILIQLCCMLKSITVTASASGDWSMYRHDLNHSGYTYNSTSTGTAKLLWKSPTMEAVFSSPAVADGYLVVGCNDYIIYCLNSTNGQLVWYFLTGHEVISSPAIAHGFVYVGSDDGWFYCLNLSTGVPPWITKVGGLIRSCPAVADGRVYVGSGNHDLYCLNASDGNVLWIFPTQYRVHSSPAVSGGVVYFATDDFHLYAVNASTGEQLWRTHTGSVLSSPSVSNGSVYIGSIDGYVWALNASTGVKLWGYKTGNSITSSPAVAYGCVYIGADDNNVYCLNASTGEKIWQYATGYWVRSSPAVADGNVYVGSEDYNIYCLDAFTGAKKWSYETGNYIDSSPAIANSTLYVSASDRSVYAFDLTSSSGEDLPSPSTPSMLWATIAFDTITSVVAAAVISLTIFFIRANRQAKRNPDDNPLSGKKASWFSVHADALSILVILAFSTILFVNLSSAPLWTADEQTYSQWAFHMVKTGDYLNPWAFGYLALWIGKPPLFMWLMSLSYQVFGVNNFAARFWSPVFGALSLVLIFYLGKTLYNSRVAGFLSALVLGTFTTFDVFARRAMTDVSFVFFIMASIYFVFLSEKNENTNKYALLSGVFFALAILTKQIEALLIPLIVFFYLLLTKRSPRFLLTKRFTLFWAVALLIIAPWLIYMTVQFGVEFWRVFLVYSNITRALNPIEGHAAGYFYYFIQLAHSETLPWVVLLPFAAGLCTLKVAVKRSKADTLLLLWMAIVLVVFSLAQTKLYWYILPAFPAFALAISGLLNDLISKIRLGVRFLALKALTIFRLAKSLKH